MRKANRTIVVLPDIHAPLEDKKALNCALKVIKEVGPDAVIQIGDIGEWESVSKWKWKKQRRPPLEYQLPAVEKDIDAVRKVMRKITSSFNGELIVVKGNHDAWNDSFIEENPYLGDKYWFDSVFEYECSKIVPCGEFHKEGDLYLYHGHHYQGLLHTRSHLLSMGENVMYGHWHDVQQYTLTRLGGTISAWSIGCLKDMSTYANKWLGGQQVNWKHAVAIVEFYGSKFFVRIVEIIDGKCSLDGKLLEG